MNPFFFRANSMTTQQTDALDLSCENAEGSIGVPGDFHARLQHEPSTTADAKGGNGAREEHLRKHARYDGADASGDSSINARISNQYDAAATDLGDLYACFGAYAATAQYVEFGQEEEARRAISRWPLLVECYASSTALNKKSESC